MYIKCWLPCANVRQCAWLQNCIKQGWKVAPAHSPRWVSNLPQWVQIVNFLVISESYSPISGLLIIRGKKREISRDLKSQIHGENGRFRGIFAGIFGSNFRWKANKKAKKKDDKNIGRMSNSGQERNTKVHPTKFWRQLYLFRVTRKTYKAFNTETLGRSTSFFSCNLEPKTAMQ